MAQKRKTKTSDCPNWQILLGEYALGTIGERDRARLERHLAGCRTCTRALADTRGLYGFLSAAELATPSPSLAAKVEAALRRETDFAAARVTAPAPARPRDEARPAPVAAAAVEKRRAWWRVPAWVPALGTVGAVVVVAMIYFKVFTPGGKPEAVIPPGEVTKPASGAKGAATAEVVASAPGLTALGGVAPREERPRVDLDAAKSEVAWTGGEGRGVSAPTPAPETLFPAVRDAGAETDEKELADVVSFGAGGAAADERFKEVEKKDKSRVESREDTAVAEEPGGGTGFGGAVGGSAYREGRLAAVRADVKTAGVNLEEVMDPRIGDDVERLTADGALFEYVTPNGSMMSYFLELSPEEQRTVLTRLKNEADAAGASDVFLGH